MSLDSRIDKFAQLAIKSGINVQPGESLLIRADVESRDFVRRCVKEAYKAGAKHVYVEYSDEVITREKYLNAPSEAFDEYPEWQSYKYTQIAKEGGSFLSIISNDPDLMKGVDPDRIGRFQKKAGKYLKEWRSYTLNDRVKWSIVAVPSLAWAKRVHPDLADEAAVEELWNNILDCSRVTEDPVAAWEDHNKNLKEKTAFMNKMNFKELRYKSSKTDLVIGLPDNHIWLGGAAKDPKGNFFNPNIPSEEIYGMPHKYKVDGIVHSTKPLVYAGSLIEDFWIRYEAGRVVDFDAKTGRDNLKNLIVFYTTLFDENASCHLAIGAAYSSCVKDGANIADEDKDGLGINVSMTHVDFMIGDKDLDIVGIQQDGQEFQIFKDGNWAF